MSIINVTGAKPYDGRYPLDLDEQPLTTREWGWIKRNAGYVPLTLTGEAFSDPELIIVLAVIAIRRAGRIATEQFAEVWDRFNDAPFGSMLTIEPDPDEVDDEDDAGPPALGNSESSSSNGGSSPTGSESSDDPRKATGSPRSVTSESGPLISVS